ncbi:ABC transporter permease [Microbacterium elymi]|uniref:ABC transporter permease n=1 Tax=Microbacterium elymi TaxID=2909587 RepID=A0ABY5NGQ3_9MICO|nr:ABC transporter permease [Microbacterium elymi]UUT34328.1 ABC transporter permease [Microbacterium elymi]
MTTVVEEADLVAKPVRAKSGGLWRFILVRLVMIIPTVFILVTVVFFLMRLTGDPITAALGGRLTPDQLAQRIHEAGYDRPLVVQYFEYLAGVFRGDFGTTLTDHQKVTTILLQYGSATLELAFYALIVAFLLGIPFGLLAAYKRDRWQDALLRVAAILGYATPIFFIAILLKLVFAVQFNILPVSGRAGTRTELALQSLDHPTGIYLIDAIRLGNPDAVADVLWHAVLPGLALGILTAGIFLRLVRINVIGTLGSQYVTSARSRGVGEYRLVTTHAYRPALIPVVTLMGLQIAALLAGAVLTETSFEWKGLGFMLAQYLGSRDFVAVQGIVIMIAVVVAVANFVVDVLAVLIDPRVRY